MRNKTFTLMLLALLVSIFSFAHKPLVLDRTLANGVSLRQSAKTSLKAGLLSRKTDRPASAVRKVRAKALGTEIVTPPADGEATYYTATGTSYANSSDGWKPYQFNRTVSVIWDGMDDVYIMGLSHYVTDMWIKGTFTDDTHVVFSMGQYLGNGPGADIYSAAQDDDGNFMDIVAEYDGENDTFTFTTIIGDCAASSGELYGLYAYIEEGLVVVPIEGEIDLPVEAPNDMEIETYVFSATDYYTGNTTSYGINVGFYGNEVYIQGICSDFPDAWIKGSVEDNQLIFPTGQLLTTYAMYNIWFLGYGDTGVEDVVFAYDAEQGIMSTNQWIIINIDKYDIAEGANCWSIYADPITIQYVNEQAGTPENPIISGINFSNYGPILELAIPLVDTDGNALNFEKLTYKIYCDRGNGEPELVTFTTSDYTRLEEDMSEIPFAFSDNYDFESGPRIYLNMEDYEEWERIGIQTIYYGGEECHESEICWYEPIWLRYVSVPQGLTSTKHVFKGMGLGSDAEEFESYVNIIMDADTMYIQGLGATKVPSAWVKGVKTAKDTYTFSNAQAMGISGSYVVCFVGIDDNGNVSDVTLRVDAENGLYVFENAFVENAGYTDRQNRFGGVDEGATINIEAEAVKLAEPATPSITGLCFTYYGDYISKNVPLEDVNGESLIADNLSYRLYYDEGDGEAHLVTLTADAYKNLKQDLTEVPYTFIDNYDFLESGDVYLNMQHNTWKRIGIQSVYNDEDEIKVSEIGWYTTTMPEFIELPDGAEVATYGFIGTYMYSSKRINFSKVVSVAKVGNDVYIQGAGSVKSDAWIKGTKNPETNVYTFASGQSMGASVEATEEGDEVTLLFLMGLSKQGRPADVQMTYDEETSIFTTTTYFVENADYTDNLYYMSLVVPGAMIIPADNPDAITIVKAKAEAAEARYNVAGQRVNADYKGIVVKAGKKSIQK